LRSPRALLDKAISRLTNILYVCACDIVALGVIFAGAVIIVQRLRGRI
jgi:hypothetical protein